MRSTRLAVVCLAALALIHALPLAGLAGATALREGYGLGPLDHSTALLLQHRALMFGLLAAGLLGSTLRPAIRGPILLATVISDLGFVLLAWPWNTLAEGLRPVLAGDLVALPIAALAAWSSRLPRPGAGATRPEG